MTENNPTESNKIQQVSTNPTSVAIDENTARRHMNQENKQKSRRGFIIAGTQEGTPYVPNAVQIGRNEPCHCGSGVKYKKCHLEKQRIVQRP